MDSVRRLILLLVASMIALPARLPGQRTSCAHADSVVRSDERGRQERMEAVGRLLDCSDTAAAAFTALLRRPTTNFIADTLGRMGAWELFDSRLVDSIAVLAKDAGQPALRRVSYLALLTRYSDCHVALYMNAFSHRESSVTGSIFDACGSDERHHPLPAPDRDRARAAIAWMAEHDPNGRLREMATEVSEELTYAFTNGLQTPSRSP